MHLQRGPPAEGTTKRRTLPQIIDPWHQTIQTIQAVKPNNARIAFCLEPFFLEPQIPLRPCFLSAVIGMSEIKRSFNDEILGSHSDMISVFPGNMSCNVMHNMHNRSEWIHWHTTVEEHQWIVRMFRYLERSFEAVCLSVWSRKADDGVWLLNAQVFGIHYAIYSLHVKENFLLRSLNFIFDHISCSLKVQFSLEKECSNVQQL